MQSGRFLPFVLSMNITLLCKNFFPNLDVEKADWFIAESNLDLWCFKNGIKQNGTLSVPIDFLLRNLNTVSNSFNVKSSKLLNLKDFDHHFIGHCPKNGHLAKLTVE